MYWSIRLRFACEIAALVLAAACAFAVATGSGAAGCFGVSFLATQTPVKLALFCQKPVNQGILLPVIALADIAFKGEI